MRGRWVAVAWVLVFFVLHNDLWLWNDARQWLGLPAGLTYHLLYCVAVSVLMGLLLLRGDFLRDPPEQGTRGRAAEGAE